MQPLRPIDQLDQSIGPRIMHSTSPVGPFFHRIAATVPCDWLIAYIGSLSSHCHVWEAVHDSPEYIFVHASLTQDRSNSAMDIELRYRVSNFKECARASVRSTPRNPCVTRQYNIYIYRTTFRGYIYICTMREIQWKDVRGKGPKSHVSRS